MTEVRGKASIQDLEDCARKLKEGERVLTGEALEEVRAVRRLIETYLFEDGLERALKGEQIWV